MANDIKALERALGIFDESRKALNESAANGESVKSELYDLWAQTCNLANEIKYLYENGIDL